MNCIEIKNLKKIYGKAENITTVLNGIGVSIKEGELCGIFGPSGSGKSTLLNIVGGLERCDAGKLIVNGKDICKYSDKELTEYRRSQIGFVFQFYNLIPDLNVKENIQVCEYLSDDSLNIENLMETMGLTKHQNKYPSQISGGQQQRCAIARAVIKNPSILLCDEPTGALDYKSSKMVLKLLETINQKYNTTILIVTHNEAIKDMVHHVIKVRDGIISQDYYNEDRVDAEEICW